MTRNHCATRHSVKVRVVRSWTLAPLPLGCLPGVPPDLKSEEMNPKIYLHMHMNVHVSVLFSCCFFVVACLCVEHLRLFFRSGFQTPSLSFSLSFSLPLSLSLSLSLYLSVSLSLSLSLSLGSVLLCSVTFWYVLFCSALFSLQLRLAIHYS